MGTITVLPLYYSNKILSMELIKQTEPPVKEDIITFGFEVSNVVNLPDRFANFLF